MLKLYRVLSYILLPIGAILGLFALLGLLMALGNLSVMFSIFLLAGTVIYIFTSFSFLNKSIIGQQTSKAKLKDWIKVNAYVAMFFAVGILSQSVMLLTNKEMYAELMRQAKTMQTTEIDLKTLQLGVKIAVTAFIIIGSIIVGHVLMTLRLVKKYIEWFRD